MDVLLWMNDNSSIKAKTSVVRELLPPIRAAEIVKSIRKYMNGNLSTY